MFKVGDRVHVTEKYPAYDLLRWHVGAVHSIKPSHISHTNNLGIVFAIVINFDEAPGDGNGGLVFYDYELERD